MFKKVTREVTKKELIRITKVIKATKRFLAFIGMLGLLWNYVPWTYIEAQIEDNESNIVLDLPDTEHDSTLPDYPTTTDPDFDPSQVAIESEVQDQRTETTKTFRKIDGTYEVAMYNDVVHYKENGEYKQVDNSLYENGNEFENTANKFKVKFPKKLDDNKQIKLSMDNYSIDWNVLNISESDIEYDDTEVTPHNIKELVNINQSILYRDILPNVDIEYILTGSKVKENIILNQYEEDFSMTFEYKLKDLEIIEDVDGNILFVNEYNETVFTFSDLYMLDSELNESFDIIFTIIETGSKTYEITVTPDDTWLQSAVYPVKIDPSITLNSNNVNIRDKYTYGTSGYNNSSNMLKVGYSGSLKYRSYIEIGIDSLPENVMVDYARLQLTLQENNCTTASCQINARMVNQTTPYVNITGENLSDVNDRIVDYQIIDTTSAPDSLYIFDLTRAIKLWHSDTVSDGVIELRSNDESNADYVLFDSIDYSSLTGPQITIGYTFTSGIKDYWTYNSQNVGNAGTGYISDYTGKLTFIKSDITFTSEKQSLGLSLIYNTDNHDTNIGYGLGWQTNYSITMHEVDALETYYSVDGTGSKVYYYSTTCDTRTTASYPYSYTCYISEDGSGNVYVRQNAFGSLNNAYILTMNQMKYSFGTDNYLDSIMDTKRSLLTTITRDSSNKDHITKITDSSGNKIDLAYSSGRLYTATLSLKQSDSSYNIIERVNYSYIYRSTHSDYALYYTRFYKNYDDTSSLTLDEYAYYLTDSNARITSAYTPSLNRVDFQYTTSGNKIDTVKQYVNGSQFGELEYTYNYQQTTLTNHRGNYINYYFDNYGHTINIRDNFSNTQFYNYVNLFSSVIEDDDENQTIITLTDGTPNYKNNHKLISYSDPMKTLFNPVNNHGFEYDNNYEELDWNYIDDNGSLRELSHVFTNAESLYGSYSAMINANSTDYGHFEQTLVLDDSVYTLSGYVKNDTNSSTAVYITVDGEFWQGSTMVDGDSSTTSVPNDGDWHYVTFQFEVDGNNQEIDIQLYNHGIGYAYFDSIQINNGFRDTRKNIIDNPSMEIVDTNFDLTGWIFSDENYVSRVDHSSIISGIDEKILGSYSIQIEGSSSETRYAVAGVHDFLDISEVEGSLIIGGWAYSEGTPSSQMYVDNMDIDDITRKFWLRVDIIDNLENVIATHYIEFDPSIEGWQYVLEEVSFPSTGAKAYVYFEYQGEGTVNFDGLQIYYERMSTDYTLDEYGHITKVLKPDASLIEYQYGNRYDVRATKVITENGEIDYEIALYDDLISEIEYNNIKTDLSHNSHGQVTQVVIGDTTGDYFTTSTTYLSSGFYQYTSTTTNEFDETTNYYHDTLTGLLTAIENSEGEDLHYVFDNEGKLIKTISLPYYTNPTSNVHGMVEYEYDSHDRLSKIIIDTNYYYELEYDNKNRIEEVYVNTRKLMSYTYETDDTIYTNRLSTQTYGNLDAMRFDYNTENQITLVEFKDSGGIFQNKFEYEYDQSGNLAVFKTYDDNDLSKVEYYTYDSSNRLIQSVDNQGNTIKYGYDNQGNMTSLYFDIDGFTPTTDYFYNQCQVYTSGECTTQSSLYDKTEYETQAGDEVLKQYVYESSSLYRLKYINLIEDSNNIYQQEFNYDTVGNEETIRIDNITFNISNDAVIDYKYEYWYDSLGNITTVKYYEDGSLETRDDYTYDELNQLIVEDVCDNGCTSTTLSPTNYTKYFYYDEQGNLEDIKTFLYGQSDYVTYSIPNYYQNNNGYFDLQMYYNGSNDYQDIYSVSLNGTPSLSFTFYDTDNSQWVTGLTVTLESSTLDTSTEGYYYRDYNATDGFFYDIDFRIVIKVGNPVSGPRTPQNHVQYSYDGSWKDQLESYGTIDYINGVAQSVDTVQEYTYDNQGNPTTITNFIYEDTDYHHADLEYDGRQLAKIIVYSNATETTTIATISYSYNDQGYRTSKTIDDGTTQTIEYTLSGDKVLYETDGTYGIIYTYDFDGKIISFNYISDVNDETTPGTEYFYIRNQQGDVTKIIDIDGNTEVEYVYDAWGNIINWNDIKTNPLAAINKYTYRGYRYDSEISMYYLNSRFYNPTTARFINSDGLLGQQGNILGHNMYAYTQNNPVMYSDISGEFPVLLTIVVVAYALWTAYDVYQISQGELSFNPENGDLSSSQKVQNPSVIFGYSLYMKYISDDKDFFDGSAGGIAAEWMWHNILYDSSYILNKLGIDNFAGQDISRINNQSKTAGFGSSIFRDTIHNTSRPEVVYPSLIIEGYISPVSLVYDLYKEFVRRD